MASPAQADVLEALKAVVDPDLRKDIVTLGFVKDLHVDGGAVRFAVELTTPACPVKDRLQEQARAAVAALPGVTSVEVTMTAVVRSATAPEHGRPPLPGVKKSLPAPASNNEWGQIRSQQAPPLLDAKGRAVPPDVRAMVSRMDPNKEAQKVQ